MHDLDRTLNEFEMGMDALETDGFELEFWNQENEWGGEGETVFDEVEEMELAATLLEIQDEEELEQFIGNLVRKAGKAVGTFMRSPTGQALGGILKSAAKKALPIVGGALGNLVAPGVGGAIGSKLASSAGQLFGLELEGMSPQDQEFEVARRFVRFAGEAVRNAAEVGSTAPPQQAAKQAVVQAAQQHAPGLVRAIASGNGAGPQGSGGGYRGQGGQGGQSGRWVRRGRTIILFGV